MSMQTKTPDSNDSLSNVITLSKKYNFLCFGAGGGDTITVKGIKASILKKYGRAISNKDPQWIYDAALSPLFLPLSDSEIEDLDFEDGALIVGRFTDFLQRAQSKSLTSVTSKS